MVSVLNRNEVIVFLIKKKLSCIEITPIRELVTSQLTIFYGSRIDSNRRLLS